MPVPFPSKTPKSHSVELFPRMQNPFPRGGLRSPIVFVVLLTLFANSLSRAQNPSSKTASAASYTPTDEELKTLRDAARTLKKSIDDLPATTTKTRIADVRVFQRVVDLALNLEEFRTRGDLDGATKLLELGCERATFLAGGESPWTAAKGTVAYGYVSKIDDSVQPYVVVVPPDVVFDRTHRARLDVMLHGRNDKLTEIRFLAAKLEGKGITGGPPRESIALHVFGRGNNAYRWAGEPDVFEAIEAVRRDYPIDDRRIVIEGFSMGGAGAWHLSLHHPSRWACAEAGAGFTDTLRYAKLDGEKLDPTVSKLLNIYDAQSYALNAWDCPIAAYGGQNDPQLQASTNILRALKANGLATKGDNEITKGEGFDFLRVIGRGMGHEVDPDSRAILDAFQDLHAGTGDKADPKRIKFATYTTKYNRAHWLTIERMTEHYAKAEIDAEIVGSKVFIRKAENVSVLGIDRHAAKSVVIGKQIFPLEEAVKGLLPNVYYLKEDVDWREVGYEESRMIEEGGTIWKRRDRQGPIDDAFMGAFLCVRGTGEPWSPAAGRWAEARLKDFEQLWTREMRGDFPVKDDKDVTDADIESKHLILFGDPGSNPWIDKIKDKLPTLSWSRTVLKLGNRKYSPADHVPVLIAPNPLNSTHYVVINSGHTFRAEEFAKTSAMLFPKLGDYGVYQTDGRNQTLKATGLFNEGWSLGTAR